MWILGIDSTGPAASCALLEDGLLRAESYLNTGYTHSETLLPLILELLKRCRIPVEALDGIAVTNGPGSFTGLRIGLSTAKGLAFGGSIPCCGVSTLEAMAAQWLPSKGILCPAMDARRQQVYNALFAWEDGAPQRLTEDRALSIGQLGQELVALGQPVWLTGDGAQLCADAFAEQTALNFMPAPDHLRHQRALGAALLYRADRAAPADQLVPQYLRLPQAERERLEREEAKVAFKAEAKNTEL